ncbi:MAG: universal stress protein [Planctomycetota bacterium]
MEFDLGRIVVGYNGTEVCRTAVRRAADLAERSGAGLDLISVAVPLVPIGGFGWVAPYDETRYIRGLLESRVEEGASLVERDIEIARHPVLGTPAPEIVKLARDRGASLIVLGGARHSALERILVGSTADRVVRLTPVPCLVAASDRCAQRVLVAADDSPFGRNALVAALVLARATGAEVRCVHVITRPPSEADGGGDLAASVTTVEQQFREFVESARARLPEGGGKIPPVSTAVRIGDIRDEVLAEARDCGTDLLVAGSHGRGFVGRAILGSVSESLMRHAPVSVLIAPGPAQ